MKALVVVALAILAAASGTAGGNDATAPSSLLAALAARAATPSAWRPAPANLNDLRDSLTTHDLCGLAALRAGKAHPELTALCAS